MLSDRVPVLLAHALILAIIFVHKLNFIFIIRYNYNNCIYSCQYPSGLYILCDHLNIYTQEVKNDYSIIVDPHYHPSPGVRLNNALLCTDYLPGGVTLSQMNKQHEMLRICRGSGGDKDLYVALRSGVVQVFSCSHKKFMAEYNVAGGEGTLVGVGKHGR